MSRSASEARVLWSVEETMADRAKEARARLEAGFRKQHEAERTAAKDRPKPEVPAGPEHEKPAVKAQFCWKRGTGTTCLSG